jgi:formyltetrahydrofolate deformylase
VPENENLRVDESRHIARLLVSCPNRHGIVAAVSGFLFESDANILSSDQHSADPEGGIFFMRVHENRTVVF